jgi:hypothetical protein
VSRAAFSKVMVALRSSNLRVAIWLSKMAGSWIRPTIAAKVSWKEAQWSRSWEHLKHSAQPPELENSKNQAT